MRLLPIFLGEPEPMLGMHDATLHDRGELRLELALSKLVLDVDPLAVDDAELLRVLGVNFEQGVGIDLAQQGNLLALGVEIRIGARTSREHERVLLHELGRGDRRALRLLVVR